MNSLSPSLSWEPNGEASKTKSHCSRLPRRWEASPFGLFSCWLWETRSFLLKLSWFCFLLGISWFGEVLLLCILFSSLLIGEDELCWINYGCWWKEAFFFIYFSVFFFCVLGCEGAGSCLRGGYIEVWGWIWFLWRMVDDFGSFSGSTSVSEAWWY